MPDKKILPHSSGVRVGRSEAPAASAARRRGSGRRSRPRKDRVLARSASEPELWAVGTRADGPVPRGLSPPSPPAPPLERPHTCFDVFSPAIPFSRSTSSASLPNPWEETKVLVSVTVEGSTGPVKTMVRLGASVGEAIAAVVETYGREGRSPHLDPVAAQAFQLHHSHFSLQSLNKSDKIGEVGGRTFYLHKNHGSDGFHIQADECNVNASSYEITGSHQGQLARAPTHHQLFAFVVKKLDKIGRRTKRIWRVVTCDCT